MCKLILPAMKCILILLGLSLVLSDFFYANAQNTQYPFTGLAISLPGKVEAENYDIGGQDIAYNDADPVNQGNLYRTEGVDIEACSEGGYNIGYLVTGEWLEYTVNVVTSANYRIELRTASNQPGCIMRLDMDGVAATREISIPNTGGWQKWSTTSIPSVALSAGQHVLRLLVAAGGFNINYLNFYTSPATNKLPVVSISAPSNGTTFTAPASFSINANAIDLDGTVTKVEFYNGTTLLGISLSAPYSFDWINVLAGSYNITAKATDNAGGVSISAPIALTITSITIPNQLPNVLLTSPINNTKANAPTNIVISADATDSDGIISRVEFYNGSLLLGTDNTAPYSYVWSNVGAGSYNIIAKAIDDQGAVKVSEAALVTLIAVVTDACASLEFYTENGGYTAGSKVKNGNSRYECKQWPYSGWCNGAAWAYAPGYGSYWSDAWTLVGTCGNTRSSEDPTTENPKDILTAFPNPFLTSTTLSLIVEESGDVSLKLYDNTGQFIKTIEEGYVTAGSHSFPLNMVGEKASIYLVKYITQRGSVISRVIKAE
jgi:hypothetical protein